MIIGIDTSCYTTSIAVVDMQENLIIENRRILEVAEGERGLAQSTALFQHIKYGKDIFTECLQKINKNSVRAVCVSSRPRSLEDSYMPVFLSGVSTAEVLAAAYKVPVFYTSHQEGHLMAGIKTSGMPDKQRFLAVHLSGGTSELLLVQAEKDSFAVRLLGGSNDLHAGQLVDRTGVALGMKFPCGPELDKIACEYTGSKHILKSTVKGYDFSLSGGEAEVMRQIAKGNTDQGALAQGVFSLLGNSLAKIILKAAEQENVDTVLLAGGVSGSGYLKKHLLKKLNCQVKVYFAQPYYAKDNAYGVALLGLRQYQNLQIGR
ncbi:MAG: O-sialoglycoprotein endopeptidase [Bacillota bacterium]|jgi:N6-L-threonylcarbamoyladenine synthase